MTYREISLADVPAQHPVALFGEYWESRRRNKPIPLRTDFRPCNLAQLLPWILILDVVDIDDMQQFRYRLTGTGCRDLLGVDYTGKLLGESLTAQGAEIRRLESLRAVVSGEPIYIWTALPVPGREFLKAYRGVFPLSVSGDKIDQIFVVYAHETMELDAQVAVELRRA